MLRFDIRPNGFGLVCDDKAELLNVDLNAFLAILRERIAVMKDWTTHEEYRAFDRIPMPKDHSRRHIVIDKRGSYGVHMGYTEKDGTRSFGGISQIWPRDVDGVMQNVEKLIKLHNESNESSDWKP